MHHVPFAFIRLSSYPSFVGALAFLVCGLAFAATNDVAIAEEPKDVVFSGPQSGEALLPLRVEPVYDDDSFGTEAASKPSTGDQSVDVIEAFGGKPTVLIFVHKLTRPGIALTRALTDYTLQHKDRDLRSAVIWLNQDRAAAREYLTRARPSLGLKVPVGISVDGDEGPGAYGLNRNVELTILIAKENKVTTNFALVQPSVSEGVKIAGEIAKVIGQPVPTADELQKLATGGRGGMQRSGMRERGAGNKTREATPSTERQSE